MKPYLKWNFPLLSVSPNIPWIFSCSTGKKRDKLVDGWGDLKTVPSEAVPSCENEPTVKRTRGHRSKRRALVIPQGCFSLAVGLHPLERQLFFWSHFWVLGLSFSGAHKVFCTMWYISLCVLSGSAEVTDTWNMLAAQCSRYQYWCLFKKRLVIYLYIYIYMQSNKIHKVF